MLSAVARDDRTVLTVGSFDGVHKGHRAVLGQVMEEAGRTGARSVVLTFDRPPRAVLADESLPLLTTVEEKARIMTNLGISQVVVIPFDHSFASLDPEEFVQSIVVDRIGAEAIVLGYDHRFGRGGTGDVDTMRSLGSRHGFDVKVVPAQTNGGTTFSSSRIRNMVASGSVEEAASQLDRYHSLTGEVVHGDGRGRQIGFPTANLRLEHPEKVVPANGVYAVLVHRQSTDRWRGGVMNIGYRPTVTEGTERVAEVHLLNFEGNLYGELLDVSFVKRLREERRFDGLEALVNQITADRDNCIEVLESVSFPD